MAHSHSAFTVDQSQILSSVNEQFRISLKHNYNITRSSWIEEMPLPDVVNGGSFISKVPEKVSLEFPQCVCAKYIILRFLNLRNLATAYLGQK